MGYCRRHNNYNCYDCSDNGPGIGIDTDGDLTVGIGGGLGIDATDGSLEIEVMPGVYLDTDGE